MSLASVIAGVGAALLVWTLFGLAQLAARSLERQRAAWWAGRPHACRWVPTRADLYGTAGGLATLVTEECLRCGQVRSEVRAGRWGFNRFGELVAVEDRSPEAEREALDRMWRRS
jgi:hypothetical protein